VKAFGCSTNRFFEHEEEKPGPGYYEQQSILSINTEFKESNSKKGYGNGFVSSSNRNVFSFKYFNSGPGPCSYS